MITRLLATAADHSAHGIAVSVGRLIADGHLDTGARLPTVRALAKELEVSPTTVAAAWRTLLDSGVIETRGRMGTFVRDQSIRPSRFWQLYPEGDLDALDLSEGVPDPRLLPATGPAMASLGETESTTSYLSDPVVPELEELLRSTWEFEPRAMTVLDGALDALDRLVAVICRVGSRVLVENPTFPPLLDLLDMVGAEVIGVRLDDEGLVPAELHRAIAAEPVALFLQPRAHNPTGISMTASRAADLASIVGSHDLVIVEDDHSGELSGADPVSLGSWLPDRTVRIRSFSKSHGPELRLAALGGAGEVIDRVVQRRRLGASWTSRILQRLLVQLLGDPRSTATIDQARLRYAQRRRRITDVFDDRGVAYTGTDGLNLWFEVADERAALVDLAARGIGAAPGKPFFVGRPPRDHLRVTVAAVPDDNEELGVLLADSAQFQGR